MDYQEDIKKVSVNFIWIVLVIVVGLVVIYSVFVYFTGKNEYLSSILSSESVNIPGDLNISGSQTSSITTNMPDLMSSQTNTLDILGSDVRQSLTSEHNTISSEAPTIFSQTISSNLPNQTITVSNLPQTKQIYDKYDSIVLPSSLSNPYIGRDYVCYRQMIGNQQFVSNRPHCMACQVDKRINSQKYAGTNTNIISTCSYTDDSLVNPTDPSIWTKSKCMIACSEMQDQS